MLVICADLSALAATDRDLGRYQIAGGASIYPFVWNVLLAARERGLGGVMTTIATRNESGVREVLDIPDDQIVASIVALGHPERQTTKLQRRSRRGVHDDRHLRRDRDSTPSPSRRRPRRSLHRFAAGLVGSSGRDAIDDQRGSHRRHLPAGGRHRVRRSRRRGSAPGRRRPRRRVSVRAGHRSAQDAQPMLRRVSRRRSGPIRRGVRRGRRTRASLSRHDGSTGESPRRRARRRVARTADVGPDGEQDETVGGRHGTVGRDARVVVAESRRVLAGREIALRLVHQCASSSTPVSVPRSGAPGDPQTRERVRRAARSRRTDR